jgi:PEP-CTERM/exosortase A-associated glycosyltransferase
MHILHVLDHSIPLHSGYAFRTLAILRGQRALGWETGQVTGPKHVLACPPEEDVDGFHFYRTPPLRGVVARLPVVDQVAVIETLTRRLDEVTRRLRPDILHAHSPVLNGLAALRVGRRLGLPVVYEVRAFWEDAAADHGTTREGSLRYRLTRGLESYVLRRARAVTVICEGLRGDIIGRGIAASKVTVIPNGVDVEGFRAGGTPDPALVTRFGLADKTVLGFMGSYYAYEGLALLLRTLPAVLARAPDVRVVLAGGGPQEEDLKRLAERLDLRDHVHFIGRVPHTEVQRYYDLMDIMVYPRLSMRLTELVTPLKPLEAMAQGKLVVASDVGGHRELLRDRQTGYLFRAGDTGSLADTLLEALSERWQWPRIQAAGRRYVEEERTWPISVGRYQDVYASVLAGERHGGKH